MDAVIEGIEQGLKERPSIRIGVLLCLMRGMSEEQNRETLEIAKRRKGTIVCGLDLAGDEGKYGLKEEHDPIDHPAGDPYGLDLPGP